MLLTEIRLDIQDYQFEAFNWGIGDFWRLICHVNLIEFVYVYGYLRAFCWYKLFKDLWYL